MTKGRVALQPAFVLHRRPYRETSLLLEAFTPEQGRIGLVARGVRRGKSRLAGLLQPFRPLLISWSGRGELLTLHEAEDAGHVPALVGRRLVSAFYLNELLLRLLQREDAHPALFQLYESTLAQLVEEEAWTLRRFERDLLQQLGYGLGLTQSADGGDAVRSEQLYHYDLERGPLTCARVPEGGLGVHGATLLALAGVQQPNERALRESKLLLRAALGVHLGPRPLASRTLYRRSLATLPLPNGCEKKEREQ